MMIQTLIVGNAHREVEDGHCIAIINPDESLLTQVVAGCAYTGDTLKNIVKGKCDLMIEIWIDVYKKDGVSEISRYQSRNMEPAKFTVK
ncbi:MAG: hypothetical protein AB7S75_19375 [Desulfococcaceae bacterium]